MTFVLNRDVAVAGDTGASIVVITAGTKMSEIDKGYLEQLAPEHFHDDGGDDALPKDWRTNEATLAHDERQRKNTEKEQKERDKAREARRAERAMEREEG